MSSRCFVLWSLELVSTILRGDRFACRASGTPFCSFCFNGTEDLGLLAITRLLLEYGWGRWCDAST